MDFLDLLQYLNSTKGNLPVSTRLRNILKESVYACNILSCLCKEVDDARVVMLCAKLLPHLLKHNLKPSTFCIPALLLDKFIYLSFQLYSSLCCCLRQCSYLVIIPIDFILLNMILLIQVLHFLLDKNLRACSLVCSLHLVNLCNKGIKVYALHLLGMDNSSFK